ncbi:Uncharacterized protein APZ42_025414 [Daphnia magna]|uniref:RNA-directed DNA polymerase n=1 Tax=Daphnia magna TaxID=35525 RepID=A0A164T426_9CRUS|nr:Uncharacterized protein APZ42_025414 [Daphnia magna]
MATQIKFQTPPEFAGKEQGDIGNWLHSYERIGWYNRWGDNELRNHVDLSFSEAALKCCNKSGHVKLNCPKRVNCQKEGVVLNFPPGGQAICFYCNEPGHIHPNFPQRQETRTSQTGQNGNGQRQAVWFGGRTHWGPQLIEMISAGWWWSTYEGQKVPAVIDTGAVVSIYLPVFVDWLRLIVKPWQAIRFFAIDGKEIKPGGGDTGGIRWGNKCKRGSTSIRGDIDLLLGKTFWRSLECWFCVDYRRLNTITIKEVYPLPRIEETLARLDGAAFFFNNGSTGRELASAHQGNAMDRPEDDERSVKWCTVNTMPRTPGRYQSILAKTGRTREENQGVHSWLRGANLKMKFKKCEFVQPRIQALGHIVDKNMVAPDPDQIRVKELVLALIEDKKQISTIKFELSNVKKQLESNKKKAKSSKYIFSSSFEQLPENNDALKNSLEKANCRITELDQSPEIILATKNQLQNLLNRKDEYVIKVTKYVTKPIVKALGELLSREDKKLIQNFKRNVKELSSFLGLASYYRKIIRASAGQAHPLPALTRKSVELKWEEEEKDAFDCIKNFLITRSVLGYLDFSRGFIIYTDASGYGIGAVLAQIHPPTQSPDSAKSDGHDLCESDGVEVVIANTSKNLNDREVKFSTTEKEAYAIIHTIDVFRPYLYGRKSHQYAATLSHTPVVPLAKKKHKVNRYKSETRSKKRTCESRNQKNKSKTSKLKERKLKFQGHGNVDRIAKHKRVLPNSITVRQYSFQLFLNYYKKWRRPIKENHDHILAGHLGVEKTLAGLQRHYIWQRMGASVIEYVKSHLMCKKRKVIGGIKAPLHPLPLVEGWEKAQKLTRDHLFKAQTRQKNYYGIGVKGKKYNIDDFILLNVPPTASTFFSDRKKDKKTLSLLVKIYSCFPKTRMHKKNGGYLIIWWVRHYDHMYRCMNAGGASKEEARTGVKAGTKHVMKSMIEIKEEKNKETIEKSCLIETSQSYYLSQKLLLNQQQQTVSLLAEVPAFNGLEAELTTPQDYKSQAMKRLREGFALARKNLLDARVRQNIQYDKRAKGNNFKLGDRVLLDVRDVRRLRLRRLSKARAKSSTQDNKVHIELPNSTREL